MKGIDQNMAVGSTNRRSPEGLNNYDIEPEETTTGIKTRPQVSSDSISSFLLMDPLVKECGFHVRSHQDPLTGNGPVPVHSLGDCFSDSTKAEDEFSLGQKDDGRQLSIWKVQLSASGLSEPTLEKWAMSSLNGRPGRHSTE